VRYDLRRTNEADEPRMLAANEAPDQAKCNQ